MQTQREVADHLDMSERNARDVLKALDLDWQTASLDEIRTAYIRDLRGKPLGAGAASLNSSTERGSMTCSRSRPTDGWRITKN